MLSCQNCESTDLKSVFEINHSFFQAVSSERLFVLYHKQHNGLPSYPDKTDFNKSRTMINSTSPISLFILNDEGELKIAAIQWDYMPGKYIE